jgi:hypothetical protein
VCRILKQLGLKKSLCKVGSKDVDRCPQRNPKNCAVNSWHSMYKNENCDGS